MLRARQRASSLAWKVAAEGHKQGSAFGLLSASAAASGLPASLAAYSWPCSLWLIAPPSFYLTPVLCIPKRLAVHSGQTALCLRLFPSASLSHAMCMLAHLPPARKDQHPGMHMVSLAPGGLLRHRHAAHVAPQARHALAVLHTPEHILHWITNKESTSGQQHVCGHRDGTARCGAEVHVPLHACTQ